MNVFKIFNLPIVRHIVAGIGISLLIYIFAIAPMQGELSNLHKQIDKDRILISELSKRATYRIENKVDVKKHKGGEIQLIPENDMNVINLSDTTATKQTDEEKTWVGRQLEKIGSWFK